MYLPPPGKIVVIGAGPIGLEAALYARYLGYAVEIFERGRVAENVLRQPDEPLAAPFVMNASPLGLAALAAQDETFRPPLANEVLLAREWVERYLRPLAQSDLLVDGLHEQTTVVRIEQLDQILQAETEVELDEIDEDAPPPPALRVHWLAATGETSHTGANLVLVCCGDEVRAGEGSGASPFGSHSTLTSSEPNLYRLGKLAGDNDFTFALGLGQIRDLFARIRDRVGLDLYKSMS